MYLAWLAGFWEGEGSIRFSKGSFGLHIAQKERAVLDEVASKTDGKVYFQAKSNSHRVYWYGTRAEIVLKMIRPYVRSDYRKAQIAQHLDALKLHRAVLLKKWAKNKKPKARIG